MMSEISIALLFLVAHVRRGGPISRTAGVSRRVRRWAGWRCGWACNHFFRLPFGAGGLLPLLTVEAISGRVDLLKRYVAVRVRERAKVNGLTTLELDGNVANLLGVNPFGEIRKVFRSHSCISCVRPSRCRGSL